MHMQTRKLARNHAAGTGGGREPVFPVWRYGVMTDIGWIAKKQGDAADLGKADGTIVVHQNRESVGQPKRCGVCPQGKRGERVYLHGDEFSIGKRLSRSEEKTARSRTGIDNALRRSFSRRPAHHCVNDWTRCVDRTLLAVDFGRA